MTVVGQGVRNASDPAGSTATLNINSANLTGVVLTLVDPTPPTPQTPTGLMVFPGDSGAVAFWDAVRDANGGEAATAYKIYWGTDAAASNQTPVTVPAKEDAVYIQGNVANGSSYYYKVSSLVGASESAASPVVGPVLIGAIPGANVLSGTVTFPGTATGSLYVGVFDETTSFRSSPRRAPRLSDDELSRIRRDVLSRCRLPAESKAAEAPWYFHYELGLSLAEHGDPQRALDALIDSVDRRPEPQRKARLYGMWFLVYLPYIQIAKAHAQLGNKACAPWTR